MSKPKKILLFLLVFAIAGATAGYLMWNKPHQNIKNAEAIKIDAATLYKTFVTDSTKANKEYLQKVVAVSGIINALSKNQQNQTVATLKTATEGAYVNCTFEGKVDDLKEGNNTVVKGLCQGIGEGDADLGIMGDVYLVRCYLTK